MAAQATRGSKAAITGNIFDGDVGSVIFCAPFGGNRFLTGQVVSLGDDVGVAFGAIQPAGGN
jgi:hypothetical protein